MPLNISSFAQAGGSTSTPSSSCASQIAACSGVSPGSTPAGGRRSVQPLAEAADERELHVLHVHGRRPAATGSVLVTEGGKCFPAGVGLLLLSCSSTARG